MILSIAMIVKDEEKYLDKTLTALKPLMKEIESELIIVDTGSTDKTVEIAKSHTDKVYFKEWTGDFAEMRNESFKYATGDWILVLDADEELVEYEKFIEFINSDKSKMYKSLGISLKNFLDENLTKYTRAPLLRIFKNENGFKYEGSIHEQPVYKSPVYNPVDGVMTFNHYGYIYEDESIRQKKMKRNEENLIKELKKDPNNPYINYQMGQNYMVLNKASEAIFYLEKSVKEYEKRNDIYIPAITKLLGCYYVTRQNVEIEELCYKYLKKDKKNIDIYYYLATAQMDMCKYNKSAENYKKYIYYTKNYELSTQATSIACFFDTEKYELNAINNYCKILIRFKKFDEALELLENTIKKYFDNIDMTTKLYGTIIELLHKMNKLEKLLNYYEEFSKLSVTRNIFLFKLESYLVTIKGSEKEKFYKVLSNIEGNYGTLNRSRMGQDIDIDKLIHILESEKEEYYGDILQDIFKKTNDLSVLKNIDSIKLSEYFNYALSIHKEFTIIVYKYIESEYINLNIDNVRINSLIELSLINNGSLSIKEKHYLLKRYYVDRYRVLKSYYKKDIEDIVMLRNSENILDYIIIKLRILKEELSEDRVKSLQGVKELIIEFPKFKDILNLELDEMVKEIENSIKESSEMRQLKTEFKSIIEKNIKEGNIPMAESLVEQYIEINSVDDEVLNIKAIIKLLKGDVVESLDILKESFCINPYNYNTIYNMACIKTENGQLKEAIDLYDCILRESNDLDILEQVQKDLEMIDVEKR